MEYDCNSCNYKTDKKYFFDRHMKSKKHANTIKSQVVSNDVSDVKPSNVKTTTSKPSKVKSANTKITTPKPSNVKQPSAKTTVAKPVDIKPSGKPADIKPSGVKPIDNIPNYVAMSANDPRLPNFELMSEKELEDFYDLSNYISEEDSIRLGELVEQRVRGQDPKVFVPILLDMHSNGKLAEFLGNVIIDEYRQMRASDQEKNLVKNNNEKKIKK
jgi:hypothetical protein